MSQGSGHHHSLSLCSFFCKPLNMATIESPHRPNASSSSGAFTCGTCSQNFRRADHLRRHELSHGFPKYLCSHPRCGMRFHRDDVRNRHESIHRPNPSKQPRKARRGVLPRSRTKLIISRSTGSASSAETHVSQTQTSDEDMQSQSVSASWDWNMDDVDAWLGSGIDLVPDDFIAQRFTSPNVDLSASETSIIALQQVEAPRSRQNHPGMLIVTCSQHL